MYLKVSSRNLGTATEVSAEEVASQTQGLEEHIPTDTTTTDGTRLGASKLDVSSIHMQAALAKFETAADPSARKSKVMVEKSWRVSPEEFIVKIDASPLHQSAARRLFNPKAKQDALEALNAVAEDNDNGDDKRKGGEQEQEPSEEHHSDFKDFWNKMTTLYFGASSSTSGATEKK